MKVLLLGKYPPIQGGTSRATYWTAHDLIDNGHEVEVITNNSEVEPTFKQFLGEEDLYRLEHTFSANNINVKSTSIDKTLYIPYSNPHLSKLLGLALERAYTFNPDIVVGWYLEPYGVAAGIVSNFLSIPLVLMHAGSDIDHLATHPNLRNIYKEIIKRAKYVLTSPFAEEREKILKKLGLKNQQTLHLGTCAIESLFSNNKTSLKINELLKSAENFFGELPFSKALIKSVKALNKKSFNLKPESPIMGIYGKVGSSKGSFALLKALELLSEKSINFRFITMSSGWPSLLQEYYKRLVKSKSLANKTWILPALAPWRVPHFLQTCDLVFFLENNFSVKFHNPRVPREILAAGKCLVLSTDKIKNLGFGDGLIDGKKCYFNR